MDFMGIPILVSPVITYGTVTFVRPSGGMLQPHLITDAATASRLACYTPGLVEQVEPIVREELERSRLLAAPEVPSAGRAIRLREVEP